MKKLFYLLLMMVAFISCDDKKETDVNIEITSLKLNMNQLTLYIGEEYNLSVVIEPTDATNVTLNWSSSNEEVLTVTDGVVTAIAQGDAIVTVSAANGVTASCDVNVITVEEEKELIDLEFVPYSTDAVLVNYNKGLFKWSLTFADEAAFNSSNGYYYSAGSLLTLDIFSTENNFSKGIPTGEFEVLNLAATESNGTVKLSKKNNVTTIDEFLVEGTIVITESNGEYKVVFNAKNSVYSYEYEFNINTKDEKLYFVSNRAYNSTILGDINDNSTYKKAVYYNGQWGLELYLGSESLNISPDGLVEGVGNAIQIYRNTNFVTYPKDQYQLSGTFPISKDEVGPNIIQPGSIGSWGFIEGSALYYQGATESIYEFNISNIATLTSGEVTVELNSARDYIKVSINAKDDALPENNNIVVLYEGECLYFDDDETGDFAACSVGFFGPFEYDSDNMNWNLQLHSEEFKSTRTGRVLMFDLLSIPTSKWSNGLEEGLYEFDNSGNFEQMSIQNAQIWNYTNGSYNVDTDVVNFVDGTLNVTKLKDNSGRYEIVVDAVTTTGETVKGTYLGGISHQNVATPPMLDRVFNPEGAEVIFTYMGEKDNGKRSNWSIEMIEANAQRDRGNDATGLILSFDIFVDGGTTFENGMPTGKFDIYEPILDPNYGFEVDGEDNRGLSNGSYTFFYIVFQGDTGTKRAWTGGSVTVEKDENGVYSVNVDMESVYTSISTGDYYRYTLKGDYKGEVKLDDFLNPQMVQARKASAASKLNKTGYSFSKTGVTE